MNTYLFFLKSFRLMLQYQPWKLALLFLLTLFLGINQGFSIALLIPFLQLLDIGSAAESSNPLVNFFNTVSNRTGIALTFETVLITYVILLTLIALLEYGKTLFQSSYQQDFSYQIRRRLFRKIILSDWQTLNSKSKHNHLQVLTEEVPKLNDYYYFYLQMFTRVIMATAHLFFALMISAKFTLLVLASGLLAFIFLRKYLKNAYELGAGYTASFNQLLKYIDDFWTTVKIAKVHNSEAFYYNKYDQANRSILKYQYHLLKNYSLPQLLYRLSGIIVLVAVIWIGYKVENIPLSSFFILILLFGRLYPQFTGISNDLTYIFADIASVKMVLQLDEDFEDRTFPRFPAGEHLSLKKQITLENIEFAHPGGDNLFNGYTETIAANQLTGIIGESGSGKTTLIDLIAGMQKPVSGRILVDDQPLEDELLPRWKSSIGYLPQDSFFIDGTIRENLVWDSRETITDEQLWKVLKQVNIRKLVRKQTHQLDTHIANYHYYFSGGERQRLALARVLLRNPQLLLLDEATSSLDPENEKQIMEVINALKSRMTIIFVTHRTSILQYFDKLIRI